jgi:hypothetical protein
MPKCLQRTDADERTGGDQCRLKRLQAPSGRVVCAFNENDMTKSRSIYDDDVGLLACRLIWETKWSGETCEITTSDERSTHTAREDQGVGYGGELQLCTKSRWVYDLSSFMSRRGRGLQRRVWSVFRRTKIKYFLARAALIANPEPGSTSLMAETISKVRRCPCPDPKSGIKVGRETQ